MSRNFRAVYKIVNRLTNKLYVGSAEKYYDRKYSHISRLRANKHVNSYLQRAWNKYGENSFEFIIIEKVCLECNIIEREQYWLDFYESYLRDKGYNILEKAYSNLGFKVSEESKRKMSLAKKGIPLSEKHKENLRIAKINNHPLTGKVGKLSARSKVVYQYTIDGKFIKEWDSVRQCAKHLNLNHANIIMCIQNKIKQTGGFVFKYQMV